MNGNTTNRPGVPARFTLFNIYVVLLILSVLGLIILLLWVAVGENGSSAGHSRPRILYLTWDEQAHNQLHRIDPAGGVPQQLTSNPLGVLDFSVSPDGEKVVYSAISVDGGSDLISLNLNDLAETMIILDCGGDQCSGPVWSPAGELLVYERRPVTEANALPESPTLWWLDPVTGETNAVFDDPAWLGYGASFSHDGTWLSYIAPQFLEIHAYSTESGQIVVIDSQTGEPAAWHPRENIMLTTEIQPQGEAFSTHLFRVEIPSAEVTNLSNELAVNDGTASFSPDGAMILFGRKVARAPMGRQLWLMQPDGSDPVRLTDEFDYNHGEPSWSPSGEQILIQRFNINEPNSEPGIWILNVNTKELVEIVTPGIQPAWQP